MRMNVLRPVGSGHVPVPLGASRSDHLLTPQTRQRSNGSGIGSKFPVSKKMLIDFKSLAPRRKGLREGGMGPGPVARRANQGAKDTTQTTVSANEAGRAAAPCAFLLRPPSSIASPSAAELANP